MDNRNDFIHVDEVFKRLKDKEEPEPSGAWLRMQELLNEEMPVGAPATGSILRKYMTPLVALLLLGSGVAFYTIKSNNAKDAQKVSFAAGNHTSDNNYNNATSVPSSNENDMGLKSNPANHSSNNNHSNNNHSGNTVAATKNASAHNNNEHQFASSNHTASGNHHSNNKNGVNTAANGASSGTHSNNGVASTTANHTTHSNGIAQNDTHKNATQNGVHTNNNGIAGRNNNTVAGTSGRASNNAASHNGVAGTSGNTNHNVTANNNNKASGVSNTNGGAANNNTVAQTSNTVSHPVSMEEQNVLEQIFPASSNGNNGAGAASAKPSGKHIAANGAKANASASVTTAAGMQVVAANWNNDKIVKDKDGSYYKEVRDTFKKIDMMERTVASNENAKNGAKKYVSVIDTLAITRVERIKYQPLAPLEMVALRQAKIIPQTYIASPIPSSTKPKQYTVTNEMVSLVPLANYKVNSRKVDPSKFNQLVLNTTQGISNYFDGTNKFYAAILLGGNTFMSNTGAFGMQFGIAGLYQLSERLTMGVEFKFANHYFSNYSINDQSISYNNISSQQVSGIEWLFKGTATTTNTAYKVNSFSELQFPITLNYSFGRLSAFGGLNLAYAFPIKWSTTNNVIVENVSSTETNSNNPFLNTENKIDNKNDFASRFGMGYVGGLSYDLSRKISLDARVTQNLWSSYSGNADNISKLFKTPTFQFSISYFFGRKERVVYIMDKR